MKMTKQTGRQADRQTDRQKHKIEIDSPKRGYTQIIKDTHPRSESLTTTIKHFGNSNKFATSVSTLHLPFL